LKGGQSSAELGRVSYDSFNKSTSFFYKSAVHDASVPVIRGSVNLAIEMTPMNSIAAPY
jgi:hypothetical protein